MFLIQHIPNEQIEHLDKNEKMVRAYDSTLYLPG